jgi:hypothetical protein
LFVAAPLNATASVCQHQSGRVCEGGGAPERNGAGFGEEKLLMICSTVNPPLAGVRSKMTASPPALIAGR